MKNIAHIRSPGPELEYLSEHSLSISEDLLLISLELGRGHRHHVRSNSANLLIVWSSLQAWKYCIIDLLREVAVVLTREDHARAWSLEGLVGSSHHDISMFKGIVLETSRHQAADMAHVT